MNILRTAERRPARQRGVTLVETSVVAAVVATLGHLVVPHFDTMAERRHVEGVAAQVETDLQLMRSLAVAGNRALRVDFSAAGGASCYVVHGGSAGDCGCDSQGQAVCRGGVEALKTVAFAAGAPVGVRSGSRSMLVDPTRGTFTPTGTVTVQGRSGTTLRVIVNVLGRVRACTPTRTPGYATC